MKQMGYDKILFIDEARTNLWIDITNFNIELQKQQFDIIIKILTKFNNFQKFQNNFYDTRKYKYFRPEKFKNKISFFKYSIQMVIKRLKYNRGNFEIFDLPEIEKKKYEENFLELFQIYLNSYNLKDFNEENLQIFKI